MSSQVLFNKQNLSFLLYFRSVLSVKSAIKHGCGQNKNKKVQLNKRLKQAKRAHISRSHKT